MVDSESLSCFLEGAFESEITGNNDDGLVDTLQFFACIVLVKQQIDVGVDDFGCELLDWLFFGDRLTHALI